MVVNVTQPNQRNESPFITLRRYKANRMRRLLINAEINSPQSPLNEQPSTSGSATTISIDEQQSNKSISSTSNSSNANSNNGSNITLNSQQPTNSNYGSTSISRPRPKREDNIV